MEEFDIFEIHQEWKVFRYQIFGSIFDLDMIRTLWFISRVSGFAPQSEQPNNWRPNVKFKIYNKIKDL
jgi:hypothetical protein